jgi:hypothetical protein
MNHDIQQGQRQIYMKENPMSVNIQVSEVIDRSVADVFHFHAYEHVHNHPRWDPYMQLEQVTDGPIGVGTIIKRINSRSGTPIEGRMEIVEFEPDRAVGMVIHDGPIEMLGQAIYEAESDDRTRLTVNVEIPGMDESMAGMMTSGIQKSLQKIKQLVESEING